MNTRKKQELLKLVKQYKRSNGRRLNESSAQNLVKIINSKLKQLKFNVKVKQSDLSEKFKYIYEGKIGIPQMPFGMIFKNLNVKIGLVANDTYDDARIVFDFKWEHSTRGSNGFEISYLYYGNKWQSPY